LNDDRPFSLQQSLTAKKHVQKLLEEEHGLAARDLEEWQTILESYSGRRLLNFLKSRNERANRLRRSCPFFAVLDKSEKANLIANLGGKVDT